MQIEIDDDVLEQVQGLLRLNWGFTMNAATSPIGYLGLVLQSSKAHWRNIPN